MFFVLELQITEESGAVISFSFDNQPEAESKYHQILSVAATSSVPKHSAVLLAENGLCIESKAYFHTQEPEA